VADSHRRQQMNNNNTYGYAAIRTDGRVIDCHFGKHNYPHTQKWLKDILGTDQVKILFRSSQGCGIGVADDANLPLNKEFPPHRGTIIIMGNPKMIKQMQQNVGGDAAYYDMLDRLAASGIPVYR